MINGGEKMPIPLIERLQRTFPSAWFADAYGLTETVSGDTFLDRDSLIAKRGEGENPYITPGKPDESVYRPVRDALKARPSEAWLVGDNLEWDVAAPQRLGQRGGGDRLHRGRHRKVVVRWRRKASP